VTSAITTAARMRKAAAARDAAPEAVRGFAACGAGSGGIGGAQRAKRASTARAPGGYKT